MKKINKYNYYTAMKKDIRRVMDDYKEKNEFKDIRQWRNYLIVTLMNDGDVTGREYGAYTNKKMAEEYVNQNIQLASDACDNINKPFIRFIKNRSWQFLDMNIRCYILPRVIDKMIKMGEI